MLDLISLSLTNAGIKYSRLDGSMQRTHRDFALRQFSDDPATTVILMSLKAGGVG